MIWSYYNNSRASIHIIDLLIEAQNAKMMEMEELYKQFQQQQSTMDLSMALTEEELNRAIAIKSAVGASEHVKPVPDFEYARLAITCSSYTIEEAVNIAYKLQCFREKYKVQDNPQDAMYTIRQFMRWHPQHLLDVSYIPSENACSITYDMAAIQPQNIQTQEQWRVLMSGLYFIFRSAETDLRSIRNGLIILCECKGMELSNLDLGIFERAVWDLWAYYPANHKDIRWLNTPPAANMIYSVVKRGLPAKFVNTWTLGGELDGFEGRLDALFTTPTLEIAQEALLNRMEGYLNQWHHRMQTYSLEDSEIHDDLNDDGAL